MITKKQFTIAVSCIGSGVGQSVINSLNLSRLPIKTVGLGTNPFAYGAYDCDIYDYTLSIYDENYIENLIEKCRQHKVDLIIPGLDDEAFLFAKNYHKFNEAGIKAIFAGEELISICRNKEQMSIQLNEICDVFVKSYNKETIFEDVKSGKVKFPFIAKPRGGFASRGIEIIQNINDLNKITDQHIIQELAIPHKEDPNFNFYMDQISKNKNPQVSEISIQIVYNENQELLGRMASFNKLNNGVPIEIVPYEDKYVWSIIDKLTPIYLKMGLKGPLNIQGRITENGLKLFEMNPRFTGITGLRALMGFNEVEVCVKEWLGIDKGKNSLSLNYNRFGMRQTADKSMPIERNIEVYNMYKCLNNQEIKTKKTVLITGSCGYLGQNLISKLIPLDKYEIWAFDIDKDKIKSLFNGKVSKIIDNYDLDNGLVNFGNVDLLLHLGFTRPYGTNKQIAESLKFTTELFTRVLSNQVPAIINISSQSVYGLENLPPWSEKTSVAPQMVYAQAKYATELFLESASKLSKSLKYTSLRLGALAGGAPGLTEVDFLSKIAKQAFDCKPISIIGGSQKMERFDIRDAVDAIIRLLDSDSTIWKPVYNLSSGKVYTLLDITKKTVEIASYYNGGFVSNINIEEREVNMSFGMDSNLFYNDMNWIPKFEIDDTIDSLMKYFSNEKG